MTSPDRGGAARWRTGFFKPGWRALTPAERTGSHRHACRLPASQALTGRRAAQQWRR